MDSEPAEIEGEAAENGDTGDTGAELGDGTGTPEPPPTVVPAFFLPGRGPQWPELREDGTHIKTKVRCSEERPLGLLVPSLFCH